MRKYLLATITFVLIYLAVLCFPAPFFPPPAQYENLELYTDFPSATPVRALAHAKLKASPLFQPTHTYRIYICDAAWRRLLFFRDPNRAGGLNLYPIPASFLSHADVEQVPQERSLAYFIAHEITHQMLGEARTPPIHRTPRMAQRRLC